MKGAWKQETTKENLKKLKLQISYIVRKYKVRQNFKKLQTQKS